MVRGGLQEWWWRAIEVPPWQPSLVTAACALAVHPWSGHSLNRPISLELHALNPFAVLTVFGVGWIVFLMTRCFWIRQYFFSAVTGMLCLLCVGLIVAVDPFAVVHNAAFALLVLLANALLFVWAVDTLNIVLVLPALIPLLVGPFAYFTLGFGGFQLILIGALLLALNLTVRHIVQRELRS